MQENRRQHCRIPYETSMDVSWSFNGESKFAKARCVDISVGGLCLEIAERIPVLTPLRLQADQLDFIGRAAVRHIESRGSKYNVGLELLWETADVPTSC